MDAVRKTMDLVPDAELRLKWPNDIFIGFAKAGGVLVESVSLRNDSDFLVVFGFGLNLVTVPDEIGHEVTALSQYGQPPEPCAVLTGLSERIFFWLDRWNAGLNFDAIRQAWIDRAGPVGESIVIKTTSGPVSATYQGLAETGALRAEVDGAIREFNYGDVTLADKAACDEDL